MLLRLLEGADVVIENFKPGSMEKWGLGYEEVLSKCFPGIIHCRISGFGADGPLGGLPGYDAILQAMVGLMSVNGDPTTGPMRLGTAMVDMGTGLYSAVGILMALHERKSSGLGQYLDMTLHDCGMALLHPQAANYFLNGKRPMPLGNPHPNIAPYEKYATATGEIFIAIGATQHLKKDGILEMYLNEVCYGVNTFGAKAAAKVYFGRDLKNLSLSQAALIAGLGAIGHATTPGGI